jgi:hypothetical protein
MAANTVIDGQGSVLSIDGVVINGVRQIRGLGSGARPTRDRTTFANTSTRSFGMGLAPPATPTVDLLTNDTDQGQRLCFQAANAAPAKHSFTCALISGTTLSWSGYVSSFPLDANTDADVTTTMGLIIDGALAGFPAPS